MEYLNFGCQIVNKFFRQIRNFLIKTSKFGILMWKKCLAFFQHMHCTVAPPILHKLWLGLWTTCIGLSNPARTTVQFKISCGWWFREWLTLETKPYKWAPRWVKKVLGRLTEADSGFGPNEGPNIRRARGWRTGWAGFLFLGWILGIISSPPLFSLK